MIVPMKKLTILCLARHKDATLDALRDMGVVHVVHTVQPAAPDLDKIHADYRHAEHVLTALNSLAEGTQPGHVAGGDGAAIVAEATPALVRRRDLGERLDALRKEKAASEPFGDFDPGLLTSIRNTGIRVAFYRVKGHKPILAPAGTWIRVIGTSEDGQYVALLGNLGEPWAAAEEVQPPARRLAAVRADIGAAETELKAVNEELVRLTSGRDAVAKHIQGLVEHLVFVEAREGMGRGGELCWLRGYCPAETEPRLREAALRQGWGLLFEEPADTEQVPTLIRNPAWVRPVKAVFDMLGVLPGYREIDVSAVFLLFFSLFFAMLIGDAGYGLVFLGLTILLKFKLGRRAPANMIPLLSILSIATIVWGTLNGAWFSIANLPTPLKAAKIGYLSSPDNMAQLCFLIGAIHLTVAHGWNFIRTVRSSVTALAQLGWICICWTMYYIACYLVMDSQPTPPAALLWIFVAGLALVFLFTVPVRKLKTQWSELIMLPLSVIGNFGDIVSYLRLYLVGSASVTLILAFNEMVKGMADGEGLKKFAMGLLVAVIIFAAHVLNIILGALAVLVHGIRLNALEFSTHIGIQWAGVAFRPFSRGRNADGPNG